MVSVIVPVRDAADHVAHCLRALCTQTWPADALEVIVVDDGSVDETRGRVRAFPVELLPTRGADSPYAARNVGLERARGANGCRTNPDTIEIGTQFRTRLWDASCSGAPVRLDLHDGGHGLPQGWTARARAFLEGSRRGS